MNLVLNPDELSPMTLVAIILDTWLNDDGENNAIIAKRALVRNVGRECAWNMILEATRDDPRMRGMLTDFTAFMLKA